MNIRKNIDYSTMFDAMRVAMSTDMPQMKLYCELGRLICQRTEKGAAVAAAEYLQQNYPGVPGLSSRNLRKMRDFYHEYEGNPELLALAMEIDWTQNVVVLEADLNTEERRWYLCAIKQFGGTRLNFRKESNLVPIRKFISTNQKISAILNTRITRTNNFVRKVELRQELYTQLVFLWTEVIGNPIYPLAWHKLSMYSIN